MGEWVTWAIVGYMAGVLIERFVSGEVGRAVRVVGAIVVVAAWLVGTAHA